MSDSFGCHLSGSSLHGISWVAIPFSRRSFQGLNTLLLLQAHSLPLSLQGSPHLRITSDKSKKFEIHFYWSIAYLQYYWYTSYGYIIQCTIIFKGCTPFTLNKYWPYSPCCTLYYFKNKKFKVCRTLYIVQFYIFWNFWIYADSFFCFCCF